MMISFEFSNYTYSRVIPRYLISKNPPRCKYILDVILMLVSTAVMPGVPFAGCPPHAPVFTTGNPRDYFQTAPLQHLGGRFTQSQFLPQHIQTTQYQAHRNMQPMGAQPQQVAIIPSVRTDGIGKHSTNQHIQSFFRQSQQTGQFSANQNVQSQQACKITERDARNMGISLEKGETLSSSAHPFIPMQVRAYDTLCPYAVSLHACLFKLQYVSALSIFSAIK